MDRTFPLPLRGREERKHLYEWVWHEESYVAEKFDEQRPLHDSTLADYNLDWWENQITQYLGRARMFMDGAKAEENDGAQRKLEMLAQQALAKGFMTFKGCVESSIRVWGRLPAPGLSSGNISHWGEAQP